MSIVLKTLKGLKALQQRADSTNNMPAQNDDDKMMSSDEMMLRMAEFTHFDANCAQKEVSEILTYSIKPSEPSDASAMDVGK